MRRRRFIQSLALGPAGLWLSETRAAPQGFGFRRGAVYQDEFTLRFECPELRRPLRIVSIADTHLFRDDHRGVPFQEYSHRMAKAYNRTQHFRSGLSTHPEEGFEHALAAAVESRADCVALVGDIFSFPSEAAIEWAQERLNRCGLPFFYVAGNHDWHYEGMPGSLDALRERWIGERLRPLYQGQHPLMATYDIHGVRCVVLDNSQYEISPAQLAFYRKQRRTGLPLLLFVHIPLYVPGRPLGFGCGHPDWNAVNDRNFELERRPRWPAAGHTPTTRAFHRDVFATPNLLGVIAGHTHKASADVYQGVPQFVTNANATGAYLQLDLRPCGSPGIRRHG